MEVYDEDHKDVTEDWTQVIENQKVTLTYNKTDTTKVVGNYTFVFKNIKLTNNSGACSTENCYVTENSISYRKIPNTATIKITDKDNTTKTLNSNEVIIKVKSGLSLTKEIAEFSDEDVQAGDKIVYKYTITNNTGTDLTNIELTDELEGVEFVSGMKDTLAAGETIEVYGEYIITEEDIEDWDRIINNRNAVVTGKDPVGNTLTDIDEAAPVYEKVPVEDTSAHQKIYLLGIIFVLIGTYLFYKVTKEKRMN